MKKGFMTEILSGTPDGLIVAVTHEKLTGEDYESVVIPAIEEKLNFYGRIRRLFQFGRDFHGFSAEAIWDDSKLGVGHAADFEAIAIVTDLHWLIKAIEFLSFFMQCPQ
jgi:hypothetical protein